MELSVTIGHSLSKENQSYFTHPSVLLGFPDMLKEMNIELPTWFTLES